MEFRAAALGIQAGGTDAAPGETAPANTIPTVTDPEQVAQRAMQEDAERLIHGLMEGGRDKAAFNKPISYWQYQTLSSLKCTKAEQSAHLAKLLSEGFFMKASKADKCLSVHFTGELSLYSHITIHYTTTDNINNVMTLRVTDTSYCHT